MLTSKEAVEELNSITTEDKEVAHEIADSIILRSVPEEVSNAYYEVISRLDGFWYA